MQINTSPFSKPSAQPTRFAATVPVAATATSFAGAASKGSPTANNLKANYAVKFGASSSVDDIKGLFENKRLAESISPTMRTLVKAAADKASQSGHAVISPLHLLYGMLQLIRDNATDIAHKNMSTDEAKCALVFSHALFARQPGEAMTVKTLMAVDEELEKLDHIIGQQSSAGVRVLHPVVEGILGAMQRDGALSADALVENLAVLPRVNPQIGRLVDFVNASNEIQVVRENAGAYGRSARATDLSGSKPVERMTGRDLKRFLNSEHKQLAKWYDSEGGASNMDPRMAAMMGGEAPENASYKGAVQIAKNAGAQQVEPKHLALAMLRLASQTLAKAPEAVTAAPDQVADSKVIGPTMYDTIQPKVGRMALDALIPLEARENLTTAQIAALVSRAEDTVEKLVYQEGKQVYAESRTAPEPSEALLQVFSELQANPVDSRELPNATVDLMRQLLTNLSEKDNQAVGETLSQLATDWVADAQNQKVAAQSPDDFKKVLEEVYQDGKGAMNEAQHAGIQALIGDYKNAGQVDSDKYRQRLDLILNKMQWHYTDTNLDVKAVAEQMDKDHTGLEKPKEKILEYVAIQQNLEAQGKPPAGKILCMDGPPGVGKTSLAQSLGKAMHRPVVRVALGGIKDEHELRGHTSTYVGALAGRIAQAVAESGSMNPIIVLDEIDKVASPEIQAAMLELLDPGQNHKFVDKFIGPGVPLDLSRVLFVATSNEKHHISGPLRDRMDIINLDGYDLSEKTAIAKNHLLPKQAKATGLQPEELNITDDGLQTIVDKYTMEAGVRNLERQIQTIAAKMVFKKSQGQQLPKEIGSETVQEILGTPRVKVNTVKDSQVGRANGLAVMGSIGGALFPFVCGIRHTSQGNDRKEELPLIGYPEGFPNKEAGEMSIDSLHDVREWINCHMELLGDRYGMDLHKYSGRMIYVTPQKEDKDGPYDGPSAGALKTTLITSVLTDRPVRGDVSMTGSMNALGKVGPIGGLKHKIRGAMAADARVVLFPMDNFKGSEWLDMPERLKKDLALVDIEELKRNPGMSVPEGKKIIVCPVERIEDVLDVSLESKAQNAAEQQVSPQAAPEQKSSKRIRLPKLGRRSGGKTEQPQTPKFGNRLSITA